MQLLAMLTMLIDHMGIAFFPDDESWRYVGRIAFPLYAYALVVGYRRTRSVPRYLMRLTVVALVSQLPYQWAVGGDDINVAGTLIVCLLALWLADRFKHPLAVIAIGAAASVLLVLLPFNYGAYALLLVYIYRYTHDHTTAALHFLLNLVFMALADWVIQIFSIFSTFLIVYAPYVLHKLDKLPIPRMVWRTFYPAHLVLIGLAAYALYEAAAL